MRIEGIRAINGPNVYHAKPVSVMTLRLGELTGKETTGFPGFTDRLLELLPGLFKHHCAKGAEGGFVERLNEGTYFGHVVEHVALELAGQLGGKGNYGKTRYAGEPGLYHVIVRHDNEAAMRCLLETSVSLVDTLIRGEDFSVTAPLERAASIMEETGPGPSTQAVITAAELRGIPWRRLTDGSLVELGQGRNLKRIQAAVTADTGQIAVDAACDKALARQLLADAFLPVPHGEVVTRFEDALPLLDRIGLPLVVKPVYGNQGRAVTMDVADAAGLEEAFLLAAQVSEEVLVEQQVAGLDYRVLVVDGNVVAASRRVPCHVVGDGSSSIAELIRSANLDARRGNGHSKPLTRIEGTDFKDLDLSRVPEADEKIVLRRAANLSQGGTAIDVTDEVHPEIRAACVRAARVIGLDVCGVDLLTSDISRPLDGAIIEVNASPGLRMHLYPDEGDARPVGEAIVSMLYPSGAPARIPVCSVTGTNGKTTTTQLTATMLKSDGRRVAPCGNIGVPVLDAIRDPAQFEVLVVELSSFQLHWLPLDGPGALRPLAAVCLNLADDHFDWHGGQSAYAAAKAKVYANTSVACVYNLLDDATRTMVEQAEVVEGCRAIGFGAVVPGPSDVGVVDTVVVDRAFLDDRRNSALELASLDDVATAGLATPHGLANVLAAAALARAAGAEPRSVRDALRSFTVDAHRTQLVAQHDDIAWIDDSKATNPHAAGSALSAYRSVVWILGGLLKGVDVSPLIDAHRSRLRAAIIIGIDRDAVREAFTRHAPELPLFEVDEPQTDTVMPVAVRLAASVAQGGDTVVLAPAAASMDQFVDYADRGNRFAAAVRELVEGRADDDGQAAAPEHSR